MLKILTHPNNLERLKKQLKAETEDKKVWGQLAIHNPLNNIEIIANKDIAEYDIKHHLPESERFYEYDLDDMEWLIYCGWTRKEYKYIYYLMRNEYGILYPKFKSYTPYR